MHQELASRPWYDVRVVGPALLVLFGLVLVFAPALSIAPGGTVGNAGVHLKDPPAGDPCPPGEAGEDPPPVFQDEGGQIGGGGGVHLNVAPAQGTPGEDGAEAGQLQPEGDPCPEEEEIVILEPEVEAEEVAPPPVEEVAPAPVEPRAALPFTGNSSAPVVAVGVALVAIGGLTLIAGRRRAA